MVGGMVVPSKVRGGRGMMMPQVRGQVRPARAGLQMIGRGGVQMMRGAPQIIQRPRIAQSVQVPQSRRGRPPSNSIVMGQDTVTYSNQKRTIVQNQRKALPQPRSVSPTPSWHTPSTNRPVSPPRLDGSNFKIKLPVMSRATSAESDDDDIISLDPPPAKVIKPNGNISENVANHRPGLQITKSSVDEGVDPLILDDVS